MALMKNMMVKAATLTAFGALAALTSTTAHAQSAHSIRQQIAIPVANADAIAQFVMVRLDKDGDGLVDPRPARGERGLRGLRGHRGQGGGHDDQGERPQPTEQDKAAREVAHGEFLALMGVDIESLREGTNIEGAKVRRGRRGGGAMRLILGGSDKPTLEGMDHAALSETIAGNLTALDVNGDGIVTGDELPMRRGQRDGKGRRHNRGDTMQPQQTAPQGQ